MFFSSASLPLLNLKVLKTKAGIRMRKQLLTAIYGLILWTTPGAKDCIFYQFILTVTLFHSWGDCNSESLSTLTKVTQLVNCGAGRIWNQVGLPPKSDLYPFCHTNTSCLYVVCQLYSKYYGWKNVCVCVCVCVCVQIPKLPGIWIHPSSTANFPSPCSALFS